MMVWEVVGEGVRLRVQRLNERGEVDLTRRGGGGIADEM